MDEEDLIDLSDLPVDIVHQGRTQEDIYVAEGWRTWIEATQRPRRQVIDRQFATTYRRQLDARYSQPRLLALIAAAAYLEPRGRDPRDIRRVLFAMTKPAVEAQALALVEEGTSPAYLWSVDTPQLLSTITQVETSCGTTRDSWSAREQEFAGMLVSTVTPEVLARAGERVSLHVGDRHLFPSQLLRWAHLWRGAGAEAPIRVSKMRGRDTYSAGQSEAQDLSTIDLDLDPSGAALLLQGCPAPQVSKYHLQAPTGYWDAVDEWMEDHDDGSTEEAYAHLQDEWDWHPNQRERPTW